MKKREFILGSIMLFLIGMVLCQCVHAQAPVPLTIDSRSPTAPGIDPYQASRTVYRVTFLDGTNPVSLTGITGWMSWSTNSYATAISTASVAVVAGTTGVIDFTFSASALNPSFGPGRYIYECGLRGSAGITVYRQGILTLRGSPYAVGVSPATWTTNAVNWATINWTGLPTTMAGYGIVDGVDLINLIAVSNLTVAAQAAINAHEALTGTNVHGLGTASTHAHGDYATAAQGALAATALQSEADTNALAQLSAHAGLTGTNAHGLGSASTASTNAFATSAQGTKADTALQSEADTNALAQLVTHTNKTAQAAHSGLGTAAASNANQFATAAQGALAATALQGEADTNALAQLNAQIARQANTNAEFQAFDTAQIATNAALLAMIGVGGTGSVSVASYNAHVAAQANTNAGFQALHAAQGNTNAAFESRITANTTGKVSLVTYNAGAAAQLNTNIDFETRIVAVTTGKTSLATYTAQMTAQGLTNAGFQGRFDAQANTNAGLQALHTAQGNTNAGFQTAITTLQNSNTAQNVRITTAEGYTNAAQTAFSWGAHSNAGYLTSATNIFAALYAADRSKLNTNIAGLTQAAYTGVVSSVAYTGVTVLVQGRTYAWGFTKQNAYGTSTLSVAGNTLIKSAAGAASNYFTYSGTDTNLILTLAGDGSSKSDVSGVYVQQITNGDINAAGNMNVGGTIIAYGAILTNPAAHIAETTSAHGGIVGTNDARYLAALTNAAAFDVAGAAAAVSNNLEPRMVAVTTGAVMKADAEYTGAVAKANAAYPASNPSNFVQVGVTNDLSGRVDVLATNTAPLQPFLAVSNLATAAQSTANAASNTAVYGSNTAISAFVLAGDASNQAAAAQATANWASNTAAYASNAIPAQQESVTNWSKYPALQNVDFNFQVVSNVVDAYVQRIHTINELEALEFLSTKEIDISSRNAVNFNAVSNVNFNVGVPGHETVVARFYTNGVMMGVRITNEFGFTGNGDGLTNIPGTLTAAEKAIATNSVRADGSTAMTGTLNMGGNALTNADYVQTTGPTTKTIYKSITGGTLVNSNLIITNVGFKPKGLDLMAWTDNSSNSFCFGYADSEMNQGGMDVIQNHQGNMLGIVLYLGDSSGANHSMTLVSWDADGATFSRTNSANMWNADVRMRFKFQR